MGLRAAAEAVPQAGTHEGQATALNQRAHVPGTASDGVGKHTGILPGRVQSAHRWCWSCCVRAVGSESAVTPGPADRLVAALHTSPGSQALQQPPPDRRCEQGDE